MIFILLITLVISCKKQAESPVFKKSDFPVSKGCYWIYDFHNHSNGQKYQLTHKITHVESTTNDTQLIHYQLTYDSIYVNDNAIGVLTNNDFTYKSISNSYVKFGDFHIQFPFVQGDKWISVESTDTLQILLHADKYAVASKMYSDIFYLSNFYRKGLNVSSNEIYFSKGVGIVLKSFRKETGSQLDRKQSYTLVDYHIE